MGPANVNAATRGWGPSATGRLGNEGPAGPGAVALSAGALLLLLAAAGRWGGGAAGKGLRSLGGASSSGASTRPASVCDCRLGEILRDGACALVSDVAAHYPLAAAGWDAACPRWVERAERLRQAVMEVQWDGCRPETFAPSLLPRFGFGAHFLYAVYGLAQAQAQGRAFDEAPGSLQLFAAEDCGAMFACYLEPWSKCGEAAFERLRRKGAPMSRPPRWYGGAKVLPFLTARRRKPLRVPEGDEGAVSLAWYHSELAGYLWRPNPELSRRVEDIKRRIGYRHPIIAMHVRHGDACRDIYGSRKCFKLGEYMAHAQRMKDRYGVANIFLATDDPEVVREAEAEYPDFRFAVAPVDRAWYSASPDSEQGSGHSGLATGHGTVQEEAERQTAAGFIEKRLGQREGGRAKVGLEAVIDTELLGQADFFIGTLGSNLGRLAFELILSRQRRVVPFASLDIGWCASFSTHTDGEARSAQARDRWSMVTLADGSKARYDC